MTTEQEKQIKSALQDVVDRYVATGQRYFTDLDAVKSGLSNDDFRLVVKEFFRVADERLLMGSPDDKPLGVIDGLWDFSETK